MPSVTVDFVTRSASGDTYNLILVETGPWADADVMTELTRVQGRLDDVVNAVLQGALIDRYPETRGHPLVIRLDGWGLPEGLIPEFCAHFADHVRTSPAIRDALKKDGIVPSLRFDFALLPFPEATPPAADVPWWKRVWRRLFG